MPEDYRGNALLLEVYRDTVAHGENWDHPWAGGMKPGSRDLLLETYRDTKAHAEVWKRHQHTLRPGEWVWTPPWVDQIAAADLSVISLFIRTYPWLCDGHAKRMRERAKETRPWQK
ncbi:MAG: hypothetical protein GY937_22975 [bacterium]|nr:hypothetical protein [bacterium]